MKLKYKAISIARAEDEFNKSLLSVMNTIGINPNFSDLVFMLRAGGAQDDEIDKVVSEKGLQEAMVLVIEGLSDSGFLGKEKIDIEALRMEMESGTVEAMKALSSSGETVKD